MALHSIGYISVHHDLSASLSNVLSSSLNQRHTDILTPISFAIMFKPLLLILSIVGTTVTAQKVYGCPDGYLGLGSFITSNGEVSEVNA